MIKVIENNDSTSSSEDILSLVKTIFQRQGHLEKQMDFEHRPEQEKMAIAVHESIEDGEHLLAEAGTGVGKSLAYLIPAIFHSKSFRRPCIIATNTINLQEQILQKDIPTVRELFEKTPSLSKFSDFSSALLVGRANYLCTTRLRKAVIGQGELFETSQKKELQRIVEWADKDAKEGIRQELSPPPMSSVWESVNAESSLCSAKRCGSDHCFYRKARARVEKADLVVVNHSLLFSLLGAGVVPANDADGVIFPNDFIIFDEAHEMPDEASEHLGLSISSWALETGLRRIYNPAKRKGLLKKIGRISDFEEVDNCMHAVTNFFNHIHSSILDVKDRVRLLNDSQIPSDVLPLISRMIRRLVELAEICEEDALKVELQDEVRRFQSYLHGLAEIIEQKDEDSVYWIERGGKAKQIIQMRSAPLDVSKVLKEELFSKNSPVVMTSATLTQKGDPSKFISRTGCSESKQVILSSPFDYEFNMRIKIFDNCPEPLSQERSQYLNFLVESIDSSACSIEGGTLALFTNYQDLNFCYHQLKPRWAKRQRSIYAQGIDHSRTDLRTRMSEEEDVLLLGAESFWKGFDVKGFALSQVIITRLPFENPNHPLLEAKCEKLAADGKTPFFELTLPNAIIRFRQGIGRLIRSRTDIGELTILDSRILRKQYGKHFISELPKRNFDRESLDLADLNH